MTIIVHGIPQPRGSKRTFAFRRQTGKLGVAVADNNPKSRDWMALVSDAAVQAMNCAPPITGPVHVEIVFRMPRPKGHYRTGRNVLRESAPEFHEQRPDLDKLARGTLDALSGIVWRDDSQVCYCEAYKSWCNDGEGPGATVTVEPA